MRKFFVFAIALCSIAAFTSCKSTKESAYKKAYDQARQAELAEGQSQQSESEAESQAIEGSEELQEAA